MRLLFVFVCAMALLAGLTQVKGQQYHLLEEVVDASDFDITAASEMPPMIDDIDGTVEYEIMELPYESSTSSMQFGLGQNVGQSYGQQNLGLGLSSEWQQQQQLQQPSWMQSSTLGLSSSSSAALFGGKQQPVLTQSKSTSLPTQTIMAPSTTMKAIHQSKQATRAKPIYAQPIVRNKVIEQNEVRTQLIEQPVLRQRIIEQPIISHRIIEQPVIQPVVTQPIIRRRIIQQPIIQQRIVEQPIIQPRIIEQPVVKQRLIQQPVQNQPITETVKGGSAQPILQTSKSQAQAVTQQPILQQQQQGKGGMGMGMNVGGMGMGLGGLGLGGMQY